jgi:hypothetical protein
MPAREDIFFVFKDFTFDAMGHLNGVNGMREEVSGTAEKRSSGHDLG